MLETITTAVLAAAAGGAAAAGSWGMALQFLHAVFTAVLGVVTGMVARRTKRISDLEEELKQATREQVAAELAAVKKRLADGEEKFDRLQERDHRVELQIATALNDIRDDVRTRCATRDSVRELYQAVNQMREAFARHEGKHDQT